MFMFKSKLDECAARYNRLMVQQKCPQKEECSICLETMFNRKIIYLPCKHYFHYNCLNEAIQNRLYTCPLCRNSLIQPLIKIGYKFQTYYAYGYNYAAATLNAAIDAAAAAAVANAADAADAVGEVDAVGAADAVGEVDAAEVAEVAEVAEADEEEVDVANNDYVPNDYVPNDYVPNDYVVAVLNIELGLGSENPLNDDDADMLLETLLAVYLENPEIINNFVHEPLL